MAGLVLSFSNIFCDWAFVAELMVKDQTFLSGGRQKIPEHAITRAVSDSHEYTLASLRTKCFIQGGRYSRNRMASICAKIPLM